MGQIVDTVKGQFDEITKEMESRIGNESTSNISKKQQVVEDAYENLFEEDDLDDPEIIPQEKGITFQDTDDPPFVEDLDEHISVKLMLPVSGELKEGTILRRKRKADEKAMTEKKAKNAKQAKEAATTNEEEQKAGRGRGKRGSKSRAANGRSNKRKPPPNRQLKKEAFTQNTFLVISR